MEGGLKRGVGFWVVYFQNISYPGCFLQIAYPIGSTNSMDLSLSLKILQCTRCTRVLFSLSLSRTLRSISCTCLKMQAMPGGRWRLSMTTCPVFGLMASKTAWPASSRSMERKSMCTPLSSTHHFEYLSASPFWMCLPWYLSSDAERKT